MNVKSILNIENNREDSNYYKIHLFKDGNFWCGYELSAILCHFYENEVKNKLKILYKELKKDNINYIKIGLRETSFNKYFPNHIENTIIIDEKHIIINAKDFINFELNKNNVNEIINNIKNKLNIKENNENIKENNENINNEIKNDISLLSLMKIINDYNVNNKSKDDLLLFIKEIKDNISHIIMKIL